MRVLSQTKISPGIYEICLDCEGDFVFQAGQYVLVHIDNKLDLSTKKPYPRAYSVASFEGNVTSEGLVSAQKISLIYQETGGVATLFLTRQKAGDRVTIQGPAGHYTIQRHSDQHHASLVFCATGTGIAPIHCILKSLALSTGPAANTSLSTPSSVFVFPPTIHLFWGLQTISDLYLTSSFLDITERLSQMGVDLECSLCVSQEKTPVDTSYEQWNIFRSRIQPILIQKISLFDQALISLCGSGEMVSQTRQLLLNCGFSSGQVVFERYS